MIKLKELRWSNAFSYGENNSVSFISSPLTQILGKNGHGKSSIALILEEVLFNKNSKGTKKGDVLNRYAKATKYSIELDFDKGSDSYTIKTTRGATQTVKLIKNSEDISAHTSTATYKIIEDIIGFDHKAFTQIVYQSSPASLEFLTATDTNRKKFFIELLDLEKYSKASDLFKNINAALTKEFSAAEAEFNTIESWINKYKNYDLSEHPICEVPVLEEAILAKKLELDNSIANIAKTNKAITQNNTYISLQNKINLLPVPKKPSETSTKYSNEIIEHKKTIKDSTSFIDKMKQLHGTCPTCLQQIDDNKVATLIDEKQQLVSESTALIKELSTKVDEIEAATKAYNDASKSQEDWEKYHTLIDVNMQKELLDKESLENEVATLQSKIDNTKSAIKDAEAYNTKASKHNATIGVISKQLSEYADELDKVSAKVKSLNDKIAILNILVKTFSTTGLVAYKIECLVKDLQEITNEYLSDMADGRFQISFEITTSDKLNVVVTDNGKDIDISSLSNGERARVNVSALLAIRKLMQSLSNNKINLLILDETVEALDIDGKEKLVEVLLKEDSLNTFLISHGFTHPLLEKVSVVKENNISRIEV